MAICVVWAGLATVLTGILAAAASDVFAPIGTAVRALIRFLPAEIWGLFAMVFYYVFFLVWYQYRRFRYYGDMISAVRRIAEGRIEATVPVRLKDDFGVLATDMNALIARLRASVEDERRAEQTKNELITNVSHDLRTPLTSILGYLGLIEEDKYRDELELRHYVQIAYAKSQRLHVLINDLFEYTRMRNGGMPLRAVRLNLTELLGQLLTQHRLGLHQAGMSAELHGDRQPVMVDGDPDKLVRVFENLLTNAMRYGQEGKRIDIVVRAEGRDAFAEIVNYGDPIPSADLPFIFDRFYRGDKSRTEEGGSGGSGLGLAIAKGIVEQHGGAIAAYSDARSTVFQVRLPQAAAAEPAENKQTPSQS